MDFNGVLEKSGMSVREFSDYFKIPYRTAQNWKNGVRQCPEYITEM